MAKARNGLYVHVSWLAKLMAGTTCKWGPWFKARYTKYRKAPATAALAIWTVEHTQLLDELSKELIASGSKCFIEDQNYFKVYRSSGLVISGTPDLVTLTGSDLYQIYDVKTGEPRNSDIIQIMLYMMCLPFSRPQYKDKEINGCLIYKDHPRTKIPYASITDTFKDNVSYFLNIIESSDIPEKSPSINECLFCDIGDDDCPERISSDTSQDENQKEIPI